jgi:hypothetical protein
MMAPYRIYSLDDAKRIAGVVEMEFDCDDSALIAARKTTKRGIVAEVWNLARYLGRVNGGG